MMSSGETTVEASQNIFKRSFSDKYVRSISKLVGSDINGALCLRERDLFQKPSRGNFQENVHFPKCCGGVCPCAPPDPTALFSD